MKKILSRYSLWIFLVLSSALILAICSMNSFLYPMNTWEDTNCILTAGRSMGHGMVLYKDIYDHKGLLLYVIFMVADLLNPTGYMGLFLLEVISFTIFLYFAFQILLKTGIRREICFGLTPLAGMLIATSFAFERGGSAEEFVLPLLMASLYYFIEITNDWKKAGGKIFLINGIFAGCVLWIKFSMLGFWFIWIVSLFLGLLQKRKVKDAFINGLMFVLGMGIVSLLAIGYFAWNGALKELYDVYFYGNIVKYSETAISGLGEKFKNMFRIWADFSWKNLKISVCILLGTVFLVRNFMAKKYLQSVGLVFLYLFLCLGILWGGKNYRYYYLIATPFSIFGIQVLGELLGIVSRKKWMWLWPGLGIVVAVIGSFLWCEYVPNMKIKRAELPQYRFAEVIQKTPNASLLCYNMTDMGYYKAAGTEIPDKFYAKLNFTREQMPEMYESWENMIESQKTDFIVCGSDVPHRVFEKYEVVMEWNGVLLLRRRVDCLGTESRLRWTGGQVSYTEGDIVWNSEKGGEFTGILKNPVMATGVQAEVLDLSKEADLTLLYSSDGVNFAEAEELERTNNGIVRTRFDRREICAIKIIDPGILENRQYKVSVLTEEETGQADKGIDHVIGHVMSPESSKAVDGDYATRWSSGIPQEEGIAFDIFLKENMIVNGLRLDLDDNIYDYPRALRVFYTSDNITWNELKVETENNRDFWFEASDCQIIRLILGPIGDNGGWNWSINEISIYRQES